MVNTIEAFTARRSGLDLGVGCRRAAAGTEPGHQRVGVLFLIGVITCIASIRLGFHLLLTLAKLQLLQGVKSVKLISFC